MRCDRGARGARGYACVRSCIVVFDKDVDFGSRNAATAHFAHLQPRAYVQRCSRLGKGVEWHARIDKRAKQHVAANAGEALQISNSHRIEF